MQATGILSLRALASRVHSSPLPLSKKESQQLLNLLSNSLDRHLDHYHPHRHHELVKDDLTVKARPICHSDQTAPEAITAPKSSRESVAAHLLEILHHPLLAKKAHSSSFSEEPILTAKPLQFQEALPWLEQRFAQANVSLVDIHICLKALWGNFPTISELRRAQLRELGATRKIEAWLQAGTDVAIDDIFQRHQLTILWMSLVVIEGRRDFIRSLLSRKERNALPLLSSYFRHVLRHSAGLEAAIVELLNLKAEFPSLSISSASRPLMKWLPNHAREVSPKVLDRFMLSLQGSKWAEFDIALITLFHPIRPETEKAYNFMKKAAEDEHIGKPLVKPKTLRYLIVPMTLRLLHRLIDESQLDKAQKVLQFAETCFPGELMIQEPKSRQTGHQRRTKPSPEEEQKYIQSLDAFLAT